MKVLVSGTSAPIDLRREKDIDRKKLIEVALPLDAINAASAREKSIRHGHPSTLHLWWARRPLAAARSVIFAQMVDDSLGLPRGVPYRGGPAAGARAAVPPHRGAGPLGEHDQRGAAGTGADGDSQELAPHLRRQCRASARRRAVRPGQAAGLPRSLRGRRRPAAGSAASGVGGPCQRPQPGGGAHQQGDDRDPAEVCRQAAGQPGSPARGGVGQGVADRARMDRRAGARRRRALLRAVDARRGKAAHRASVSAGGGHRGDGAGAARSQAVPGPKADGDRLAVGAHGEKPEPGLRRPRRAAGRRPSCCRRSGARKRMSSR